MSCGLCRLDVGSVYDMMGDTECAHCGLTVNMETCPSIYHGYSLVEDKHVFRVLHSYRCPSCLVRLTHIKIPCEDDYGIYHGRKSENITERQENRHE